MINSYVFFGTEPGNIDNLADTIIYSHGKFVKHIMGLYEDKGLIVRFVTKDKKQFEEQIRVIQNYTGAYMATVLCAY